MADPTAAAERRPTRDEIRILDHYAKGEQIKHICTIVGQDTESVREVIDGWAGFTRQRAKEVVARWRASGEPVTVNPSAEPPPAHHKSPPPEPAPDGGPPDPPSAARITEPATPQPKRAPRRPAATEVPLPLELILIRAVKRGGEQGRRAGQLRQQILDLGAELDDLDRIAAQQKRVAELRAQLDAEEAKLRDLTSPAAPKQEEAAA